jgi:hypothetical protein
LGIADATRLKKKAQLKEYKTLAQQLREEISNTATQLDAGNARTAFIIKINSTENHESTRTYVYGPVCRRGPDSDERRAKLGK